jgi:pimeloyl-ACP methyl ester carboxylesterase
MTITPFIIPTMTEEAAWIRQRVVDYRWFEEPPQAGWAYGANRDYMQRLQAYWLEEYNWPRMVETLNARPHFRATVEDTSLHFMHVRSPRADAKPLLISHGWPSTVYEFWKVIEPLCAPQDPALPAFHIIAPSLPGYGWSDKPEKPIGPRTIARLYDRLMHEVLGYSSYIAQGGDWGSLITGWIGIDSAHVEAIHLNGYGLRSRDMTPQNDAEKAWVKKAKRIRDRETAYLFLQATKPQSLNFAMMDSPMGIAAWICEKFCNWGDTSHAITDPPFSFEEVLTEIMIFLTTRSFATSTWLYRGYYEEQPAAIPQDMRVKVPTGVANFPHDLLAFPPRTMVERSYNVQHWTDMPRGGHFAAWEEPALFVEDVRRFVLNIS